MRRVEITLNETQIKQERIFIPDNDRNFFPPPDKEFTIKTDIVGTGEQEFPEAKVKRPHDEYHIHLKKTGWFKDFDLRPGDKLVIEEIEPKGVYRLIEILRE